ncbi:MAG: hypothetical protein NC338_03975 [Firmicutes bacterium]|nr:hypothetical protein [Bacillota bacterium]MCM1401007.1 hypothetical protein [Bacteroides sp.]MCM1476534.1 hypothetical protein [Bacteroides sp.]
MITQKVIDQLYKTYKKPPLSADDLEIDLLFTHLFEFHDIAVDNHANLVIGSFPADSPFRKIPLSHIHAIVEFEDCIAIVLHSSIIFLNKKDNRSSVHVKMPKQSLIEKLFNKFDPDA